MPAISRPLVHPLNCHIATLALSPSRPRLAPMPINFAYHPHSSASILSFMLSNSPLLHKTRFLHADHHQLRHLSSLMMLRSIKSKGFSIVACSNADYSSWCSGKAMAMNTTSGLMRGMSMPEKVAEFYRLHHGAPRHIHTLQFSPLQPLVH